MSYERLTDNEYNLEYDLCCNCKYYGEPNGCNRENGECVTYERFMEIYNRLAELEDKIENDTLKDLPCKVGGTVYEIDYNQEACYECQYYSTFFGMDTECEKDFDIYPDLNTSKIVCDKHFLEVSPIRFSLAFYERNMGSFNKTWFLTKAEAEEKLRELRGEK